MKVLILKMKLIVRRIHWLFSVTSLFWNIHARTLGIQAAAINSESRAGATTQGYSEVARSQAVNWSDYITIHPDKWVLSVSGLQYPISLHNDEFKDYFSASTVSIIYIKAKL